MSDTEREENAEETFAGQTPDAAEPERLPASASAPAPEDAKKAPGFFKKRLTEKQLKKAYLKYIEQPADKTFIRSCYTQDGDTFSIRQDLNKKEVKRLALLKSAIKKNRKSAVKFLPLTIAAAFIAALVIFFTFFANPLLRKAMETGLEAIFEARVNAEGFRLSLFRFEIAMDGLTIADRDAPMRNLIQFDAMRIRLKPAAVLRGKVYIEELRTDHIRFATDRTVSGALPDKPSKEKKPREAVTLPPLVDLANFDPAALLNQEYDKLQTPKLYDSAKAAYETAAARWKAEEEALKARIAEIRARAEPLLKISANDYRTLDAQTVERIRTTVGEVNALVNTVQTAQDDVNRIVGGVEADINTARTLEQNARNAFSADFNHLRSYINLESGAAMEVLEPLIRDILTDSAENYIAYAERGLEILEKVKSLQAKLPRSAKPEKTVEVFRGRDVIFPTRQYPRFFLGTLAADVLTPSNWQWGFDLKGVSSDPDLSGTPTSLDLSLAEAGDGLERSAAFNGRADFRSNASERFNVTVSGGGFPLDISAGLSQAGIEGFSGGAAFTVNAAGNTDGSFSGGGDISLVGAKLTNPSNTFAQAADEAIRQVNSVDLGIKYAHQISGADSFSISTNFGEILKNALGRIVARYRERAEEYLERALREKIAQYVDGQFVSKEDLDLVFAAARGDKSAVDGLKNALERKKTELENRIKSAAEDAAEKALDEVREQSQQTIEDMFPGQTPALPGGLPNPFRR